MTDGDDLLARIARAGQALDPGLRDRDVERLIAGAHRRRGRRALARAGVVAVVAGAGAWLAFVRPAVPPAPATAARATAHAPALSPTPAPTPAPAAPAAVLPLRLADGSVALP